MNYWTIQLHPDNAKWGREKDLLRKGKLIGIGNWKERAKQQHDFEHTMQKEDIVLVKRGEEILALVEVIGDYEYSEDTNDLLWFQRRRQVKILDWYNQEYALKVGKRKTLERCNNKNTSTFSSILKWLEILKNKDMNTEYLNTLKANKNLIFTGAPGTGKTYLAKEIAKAIILESRDGEQQDITTQSIEPYLKKAKDMEPVNKVDDMWSFWRSRISSEDFSIDDYANTKKNIENTKDTDRFENGYYLTSFLERASSVYGRVGVGNAFNYGIKMNRDNLTYTTYDQQEDRINKENAIGIFNESIRDWLQGFINASFEEKITLAEEPHPLIRAVQLIKKMIVLEHPDQLLYIYKDETIRRAYEHFIGGNETSYFAQNVRLVEFFLNKYNIERSKINLMRLTDFVWNYFGSDAPMQTDNNTDKEKSNELADKFYNERMLFVQFHPSYDYTDFVEGLRPVKKDESELGFELKDGVFKDFCKKALDDPDNHYVIIIDEINRAEISKVFGELFFSIDPDYRGIKGKVKTQYSNLQDESDVFVNGFYVPEKVFIIGTMNDIDRSVESMDFAMRRRFAWQEIKADTRVVMWDGKIDNWKDEAGEKMKALNTEIENIQGLSPAYHIGPAYFLKLEKYNGDFEALWTNHIEGVIFEYLRGLPNSVELIEKLKAAYNLTINVENN